MASTLLPDRLVRNNLIIFRHKTPTFRTAYKNHILGGELSAYIFSKHTLSEPWRCHLCWWSNVYDLNAKLSDHKTLQTSSTSVPFCEHAFWFLWVVLLQTASVSNISTERLSFDQVWCVPRWFFILQCNHKLFPMLEGLRWSTNDVAKEKVHSSLYICFVTMLPQGKLHELPPGVILLTHCSG